jgi:hypothetical protein
LTAISPGKIEARRVPASSHPAIRDVAKTYISPGRWTNPWRRVSCGQPSLADVSIRRKKQRIDNGPFYPKWGVFSSGMALAVDK